MPGAKGFLFGGAVTDFVTVRPEPLAEPTASIFSTASSSRAEVRLIADNLLLVDLSGQDLQGIGLIPLHLG